MEKIFVPDDFYCPISGDLMIDPVSEPEENGGHTYEKLSIFEWLDKKQESPITRSPLCKGDLKDNPSMRKSIESIRSKLSDEQLKVESRVFQSEHPEFIEALDEISLKSYYDRDKLMVQVTTPEIDKRPPVDIVLCIDISGSMGEEAPIKGSQGETIHTGISVLSLTITAAKTIISCLDENDNISVVVYTDVARKIVENIECSSLNKHAIISQLDELKPEYTTNIWDGIQTSLDILKDTSPPCRQKNIFLLTDGIPNIVPPRGHETMLTRYFQQGFKCPITTFGFGYNLDSVLLNNISNISGGDGFSYIPDSSLLGNVFIHGISNFFTNAVSFPNMNIKLLKGLRFMDGTTEKNIIINSLKYGQDKNLMFDIDTSFRTRDTTTNFAEVSLDINGKVIIISDNPIPDINYYNEQIYRNKLINCINDCTEFQRRRDSENVKTTLNTLIQEIKTNQSLISLENIRNMVFDLEGQITESLNITQEGERGDWYSKWGRHYLLSLVGAYSNELCNNFKDKGISNYGGEIFQRNRDLVSDVFDSMPPPKQTINKTQPSFRGGGGTGSRPPPVANMSVYNNASGGCCAYGSLIKMYDGSTKTVQDIVKGDIIVSVDSNMKCSQSYIECVVRTKCDDLEYMVNIGNLHITPYHPIIINDKWTFPINMSHCKIIYMDTSYLYTFVVNNRGSVIIDNYTFSTFGHNMEGDVIQHPYFGTDDIITDLKKMETYDSGLVDLNKESFIRDKNTQLINGIV